LDWKRKSVADTALGPDHLRRARIRLQFAPQPQDLHIDTAVENVPVYSGCLQELFAAEGALRRIEKGRQQRIFPLGQRDLGSGGVDKTAETPIELPATEVGSTPLRVTLWRAAPGLLPSKNRPDSREKLAKNEGLGDVIIGPEFEPNHSVDLVAPIAGDDDHRNIGAAPNLAQQVEPILLVKS
jgi:hypothetical protein